MIYQPLSILTLFACFVSLAAVRYGDYSVARMPQYSDQQDDSDLASERDEYSDRSPDASARLDYKYEELHGKSDDLSVRAIDDEMIWDKPIKKKKNFPSSRSGSNLHVDKYTLEKTEPEPESHKRFVIRRSNFRKRDFAKHSDTQSRLPHNSVDRSDSIENEDLERANGVDIEEINQSSYRSTPPRKPRRKPRDRVLHQSGWRENTNDVKLELDNVHDRSEKYSFRSKNSRRFDEINNREAISKTNKNNYNYDEYYDMQRVQNMKSRLPALFRKPTVRTMVANSTTHSDHWLNRRARTPVEHSINEFIDSVNTSMVTNAIHTSTITTTTSKTTPVTKLKVDNSSDLTLAEKSRLSILKKVQRKENSRNVSSSTKPPVLMQVTRKMQTMVMVEPPSPKTNMRAREALEESPERLKRARRLMRHKLVAGARSIHELTDNWDEMICDYIDVSLLDTDAASYFPSNIRVRMFLVLFVIVFRS